LICSEKQAIDATLKSLAAEDKRFSPVADRYWNARGGSSSDGGSFIFTVKSAPSGGRELSCINKFGQPVVVPQDAEPYAIAVKHPAAAVSVTLADKTVSELQAEAAAAFAGWNYATLKSYCKQLEKQAAAGDADKAKAIEVLTYLNDRRLPPGAKKRSWSLDIIRESLTRIFKKTPSIKAADGGFYAHIDWSSRKGLRPPQGKETVLIINAQKFQPEGDNCDALLIVKAYQLGWKRFIVYGYKGQRFTGCGLSKDSDGVRIDVYDSSGDYLASGIDGLEIYVHGNAQDQVGQILKRGKVVIYGDVGQTFMYGAKGGEVYVLGNAAGRPLINAVGRPRIVINGTCLDYLAESFMAGDPLNGGGFVVMNGLAYDDNGSLLPLESPYPGSNLFSLASGGAIYMRDPQNTLSAEQLNGGEFAELSEKDWQLILPYLQENERLFGISLADLLTVDGVKKPYNQVYRKVQTVKAAAPKRRSKKPSKSLRCLRPALMPGLFRKAWTPTSNPGSKIAG
jgi:glutamate synthase domain-containing protein 3